MSKHDPPLEIEEPLTLQLPRRIARGALQGAQVAGVGVVLALIAVLLFQVLLGWMTTAASAMLLLLAALASFTVGAIARRHELPPAAAVTVGADGITARSENFMRYYAWANIRDTRSDGSELVLMVEGGYAFRVPFRSRSRLTMAQARISTERQAHTERLAAGVREQRDAVEAGEEAPWIKRQRQRLGSDYRRGHESVDALCAELLDVDFQLQQRLGAAIALAESSDPKAQAALASARVSTGSHTLRDALDAIIDKRADDTLLMQSVRMMHPAPRRFAPIGAVREAQRIADAPRRIETDDESDLEAVIEEAEAEAEAEIRER